MVLTAVSGGGLGGHFFPNLPVVGPFVRWLTNSGNAAALAEGDYDKVIRSVRDETIAGIGHALNNSNTANPNAQANYPGGQYPGGQYPGSQYPGNSYPGNAYHANVTQGTRILATPIRLTLILSQLIRLPRIPLRSLVRRSLRRRPFRIKQNPWPPGDLPIDCGLHRLTFKSLVKASLRRRRSANCWRPLSANSTLWRFKRFAQKRDDVLPRFLSMVNANGGRYQYLIGPRLGRTVSTEQYAYLFDTSRVEYNSAQVGSMTDPATDCIVSRL